MEERVTIRELARASGVSVGTVSRALNGYADVRPETRERIMRLARELDYTPAAAARISPMVIMSAAAKIAVGGSSSASSRAVASLPLSA